MKPAGSAEGACVDGADERDKTRRLLENRSHLLITNARAQRSAVVLNSSGLICILLNWKRYHGIQNRLTSATNNAVIPIGNLDNAVTIRPYIVTVKFMGFSRTEVASAERVFGLHAVR